jgi:SAM-dependent methyltransferase
MRNEQQIAYWNGEAGRKWADRDAQMAALLAPIAEALMDHAAVEGARAALDIGCGGGSDTMLLARRLGPRASVLGVDISVPMLEVARARLATRDPGDAQVAFLEADAASHDFGEEQFDLLFSRFGVMFFDDPTSAFAALRLAGQPGARLAFACWQGLKENPWVALPLQAALTVLPPPEPTPPRAPGPFAFAEPDYLRTLLGDAGWTAIDIQPHAAQMRWDGSAGYETAVRELVNTGPVGRLLADASEAQRKAVHAAARSALEDYFQEDTLVLPGAVWLVTATNGGA